MRAALNAASSGATIGAATVFAVKHNVAILDFIEKFVVRFVETLDRQTGAKNKVWAVMGGSLGGNITFRLGRRNISWIRNVVTWSPASIWNSATDNPEREIAVKTPFLRAGGDPKYIPETAGQRKEFFDKAFGKEAFFLTAQNAQWWGDSFRCKAAFRRASRVERYEIYNKNFRKWHWRLGAEQMLYTHRHPPHSKTLRFMSNRTPMLLAAGAEDNFTGVHIYDATRDAARQMNKTPGRALFLLKTGHSIHNERPNYFAKQFVSFLKRSHADQVRRDTARFSTVEVTGMTTRDDIRRNGRSRGWVGVKLRSGQVMWSEVTDQANKGRRNLPFRTTIRLGRSVRARDIAALLVRHHSGNCFGCARDYWYLRAELAGGGVTLARTGDFHLGHQTRTFPVR